MPLFFSLVGLPSPSSGLRGDLGVSSPRPSGEDLEMGELISGMHDSSKGMKDKSKSKEGESSSNGKL